MITTRAGLKCGGALKTVAMSSVFLLSREKKTGGPTYRF
eukprot:COSAG01_NODE_69349_length_261_cov_1.327160_1_plen_38_part_01